MRQIVFVLVLFFINAVYSQKSEIGNVTKSELKERRHTIDTSAPAAFLFKKAKTTFKYTLKDGFVSYTEFKIKLKIYKKEGLMWANFKIPFYIGYSNLSDEFISIESAITYNLDNDKIVKTKITGEGKFIEKINEFWSVKTITFPNVKIGSIIELNYIMKTENLSVLPEFQFQYDIPVNNVEFVTEIPELYIYKGIQIGFVDVTKTEKIESTSQSYQAEHNMATEYLNYRQIKTEYIVKNVPAIKDEVYVNNINNYYGKILHELQTVRMPDEEPKQIAKTWADVAKSIYDDKDFDAAINKYDYFATNIKLLINGLTTAEEKIKKIFSFVKGRMNWNEKYGYYPSAKMELAYADKVGNIAEINLMLVSMLRMSGIDAYPVLVSTRDNGVVLFPNKSLFNCVIVAALVDEKTILLDATDKNSEINILPIRDLNGKGRLIKKDGSSVEIDLMPKTNSRETVNLIVTLNPQGEVTGKIRKQYFDYNALLFQKRYKGISKESYVENFEKIHQGIELTEYEIQNSNDLSKPITENYTFTSNNSVEIIGDKMYFSPFLFFAITENPFKQDTREYPIDFIFPNQDEFKISIKIPDGYVVENLPLPKSISMPDDLANFKYNITNNGSQIQLIYTLNVNQAIIESEYYEALKNFFKEIVNKQTEKIVLKKV